jgi:hypothetical protein
MILRFSTILMLASAAVACQDPSQPPVASVQYGEILLRLNGRDIHARLDYDSTIGLFDTTAHRVLVRGSTVPGFPEPDYFGLWLEPFVGTGTYTLGTANTLYSLTFFLELSPGSQGGSRIVFETDPGTPVTATVIRWNPVNCEIYGSFEGHVRQGSAGVYPVEGAFWGRLLDARVPGGKCSDG